MTDSQIRLSVLLPERPPPLLSPVLWYASVDIARQLAQVDVVDS